MNSLTMWATVMMFVITAPLLCTTRNVNANMQKRSTERQSGSRPLDHVNRHTEFTRTNAHLPPDDVTFKQEDRIPDITNPADDVTFKQEESHPESFIQSDDVAQQNGLHSETNLGQNAVSSFAFNLPPWLMFFNQLWNQVLSNQNELKAKFPTEFEAAENEIRESNAENEIDTGWGDGGFESANDDVTEINHSWMADNVFNGQDVPDLPDIYEAPENNFEPVEADWSIPESPESTNELELAEIPESEHSQEVDNTEHDSTTQERDQGWDNGYFGPNNWFQGMANTAMTVLERPETPTPNDDIPDRLKSSALNTNDDIQVNGLDDLHRGSDGVPDPPDLSQAMGNGMNNGMTFPNPFAASFPVFGFGNNANSQFQHHNTADSEQDSSS